jgi:hypothetical protein
VNSDPFDDVTPFRRLRRAMAEVHDEMLLLNHEMGAALDGEGTLSDEEIAAIDARAIGRTLADIDELKEVER